MKPIGNSCNLCCKYCYNNPVRDKAPLQVMTQAVFRHIVEQFSQQDIPFLRFIWHGGEPVLAGLPFYHMVLAEQEYLRQRNIHVENSIQTNATLLTQEWVAFFQENNFRPSVSLDGPPSVHNANRVDCAGRGSYDLTWSGIQLLLDNEVPFGISAVVTKASLHDPLATYHYFRESGVTQLDLAPCAEIDHNGKFFPFSVEPNEYAEFMSTIFDTWFEADDPNFRIRRFSEMIQGIIAGTQLLCTFLSECYEFLAIDWNGDMFLCGRFMGTDDMLLGNLMRTPLPEILASTKYQTLKQKISAQKPECVGCEWKEICNGGCTYYRYLLTGKVDGPSYFCSAYKALFTHISETIRPLMAQTQNGS
ncbi:SPASM domain-containing protein [Patescibacteria group bacterium]|nr:SPASM domain-containing protein [Patescibacteria group bacterium]